MSLFDLSRVSHYMSLLEVVSGKGGSQFTFERELVRLRFFFLG